MQCSTLGNMSVTSRIPNVVFLGLLISLNLYSDQGFSHVGAAEQIVDTEPHVVLEVGARGILPCRIQRQAYSFEWKRQLPSGTELLVSLDPFFIVGKRDGPGYEAGLFNITDDYSLVIKDVKVQDEGLYLCEFFDYKTLKAFRNSTRVSVQAFPDEPFPTIQECIGNFVKPGVCTLAIHAPSNLTCFVKGYYPNIDLFFLHGSEKVTPSEYEEWNNTDGTKNKIITVQISISDEPYECMASRLPGNAGNRSVSVIGQARSKDPNAAAIVTPVLMVFVVCFSIAGLLKCYLGSGRVFWCNRRGYVLIPSMVHLKAPKGPISKIELWKLVQKVKEKWAFKKLRDVLRRLRGLSKTGASKLEKDDDFYESLCIWKSGTSANSNQRKTLYYACCQVGLSDITKKLEDFVMDSSHEVSQVNIEHILWEIGDSWRIIVLVNAFGLDHEAVAIASEKGRKEVIETARKELVKWLEGDFDINPEVTLSLKLDDLQCETNFFKVQSSQKEEIDVEEIKKISSQICKPHYSHLLEALRDSRGEVMCNDIDKFVEENNASLFDTVQLLRDWVKDEECSNYEKRNKLTKAVQATLQRDHTDDKWPPDNELKIIATFLSPASFGQLGQILGIRTPLEEANEHKRFQALTEWRDNHTSSKDLKEKHSELFTALKQIKRGGLIPRVKGQLVYKAELVDLAFHLFAQDLIPFIEALGISAAKLVDYRPTFHPSHMKQGTIGLMCKLFEHVESGKRSDFIDLLKQMPYLSVLAYGMLALEISFEEVCAISVGSAICQEEERKRHPVKKSGSSPGEHNSFAGIIVRRTFSSYSLDKHTDATSNEDAHQRSQNENDNETANGLRPMLTSGSKVEDPNKVSPQSSAFIGHYKLWRKQPRKIPVNIRLAIFDQLRMEVKPDLISNFLQGKCNKGKIPFPFIDDILQIMNPKQRCILGNVIRAAPFTTVAARLSIFPFQEEEWSRLEEEVSRNMHAWTEEWIRQIIETKWKKGEDGVLTTAEIAKKHKEFNDKLVDNGFLDLAREIMISEQQLIDT